MSSAFAFPYFVLFIIFALFLSLLPDRPFFSAARRLMFKELPGIGVETKTFVTHTGFDNLSTCSLLSGPNRGTDFPSLFPWFHLIAVIDSTTVNYVVGKSIRRAWDVCACSGVWVRVCVQSRLMISSNVYFWFAFSWDFHSHRRVKQLLNWKKSIYKSTMIFWLKKKKNHSVFHLLCFTCDTLALTGRLLSAMEELGHMKWKRQSNRRSVIKSLKIY